MWYTQAVTVLTSSTPFCQYLCIRHRNNIQEKNLHRFLILATAYLSLILLLLPDCGNLLFIMSPMLKQKYCSFINYVLRNFFQSRLHRVCTCIAYFTSVLCEYCVLAVASVIRLHRSTTYLDAACCYRVSSLVCLSVCLQKTAKLIEMPFGLWARIGPRNHVLGGGAYWCHLLSAIEPSMWGGNMAFLSNYFDHLFITVTYFLPMRC